MFNININYEYKDDVVKVGEEEIVDNGKDFIVYHLGGLNYKQVKSANIIISSKCKHNTKASDCIDIKNKFTNPSDTISAFLNKVTKENIELLRDSGFEPYIAIKNIVMYSISLKNNESNIEEYSLYSTPQEIEYHEKFWKSESSKAIKEIEKKLKEMNISEQSKEYDELFRSEFIKWKKEYKSKMRDWIYSEYGLKLETKTLEEFINILKDFEDLMDTEKYFRINTTCGDKRQYATCIPHVQLKVTAPLNIKSRVRLF